MTTKTLRYNDSVIELRPASPEQAKDAARLLEKLTFYHLHDEQQDMAAMVEFSLLMSHVTAWEGLDTPPFPVPDPMGFPGVIDVGYGVFVISRQRLDPFWQALKRAVDFAETPDPRMSEYLDLALEEIAALYHMDGTP